MNRIREGCFLKVNPFNPGQTDNVSLHPQDVDAIVFWTKNPAPLLKHLPELDDLGYRYYFHFTVNNYPKCFEPIPPLSERLANFQRLSDMIGRERVIWRYDPIILSNITPVGFHEERFGSLAESLCGFTTRVVISFLDIYRKVLPRLRALERKSGVAVQDITQPEHDPELKRLCSFLVRTAASCGLEIFSCSEPLGPTEIGIEHGSCIDNDLIERLWRVSLGVKRDKSQRAECLCAAAADMGVYNTCRHGCVYCYANSGKSPNSPPAKESRLRL